MASGQPGTQQETNTTALANNGISRGQIIYATMVNYGQWAGLFVMIVTFWPICPAYYQD